MNECLKVYATISITIQMIQNSSSLWIGVMFFFINSIILFIYIFTIFVKSSLKILSVFSFIAYLWRYCLNPILNKCDCYVTRKIDGLVQQRRNSIANALELRLALNHRYICYQTVPFDHLSQYQLLIKRCLRVTTYKAREYSRHKPIDSG